MPTRTVPILNVATPNRVAGSFTGTIGHYCRIEAFASAPDPTNYGEGENYLGYALVQIPSGGAANFVVSTTMATTPSP